MGMSDGEGDVNGMKEEVVRSAGGDGRCWCGSEKLS